MKLNLWFLTLPVILLSLAGCQSEPERQSVAGSAPAAVTANNDPAPEVAGSPVSNYGSDNPSQGETSDAAGESSGLTKEFLMNQRFVLVQIDGAAYTLSSDQGIPTPTLAFDNDFLVSGRICNTFRGGGELVDGVLTVKTLAATRMLCGDPSLNQLETRFFQMLEGGAALSMNGDRLYLKRGDNALIFKAETSLE